MRRIRLKKIRDGDTIKIVINKKSLVMKVGGRYTAKVHWLQGIILDMDEGFFSDLPIHSYRCFNYRDNEGIDHKTAQIAYKKLRQHIVYKLEKKDILAYIL